MLLMFVLILHFTSFLLSSFLGRVLFIKLSDYFNKFQVCKSNNHFTYFSCLHNFWIAESTLEKYKILIYKFIVIEKLSIYLDSVV